MRASQIYPVDGTKNTFTTCVERATYRYFNGRKYYDNRTFTHFIYPESSYLNWVEVSIWISLSDHRSMRTRRLRHDNYTHRHPEGTR